MLQSQIDIKYPKISDLTRQMGKENNMVIMYACIKEKQVKTKNNNPSEKFLTSI